jgi:hypothetical protein
MKKDFWFSFVLFVSFVVKGFELCLEEDRV